VAKTVRWKDEPEAHDYPAAGDYLELVLKPADVRRIMAAFRRAKTVNKKAKDLARASRLPLLGAGNPDVARALKKVRKGEPLSPVLLVRGAVGTNDVPLTVADGYHRICASNEIDEDADIPCRIVDL
jgi:hypothetical protein